MTLRSTDSHGIRRIMQALLAADGPQSIYDLAPIVYLTVGTCREYCRLLVRERHAHIAEYRTNHTGNSSPYYAPGPLCGPPARRPPPRWESEAERSRAYRRRTGSVRSRVLRANAQGKSMLAVLAGLLNHKAGDAHE